MNGTLVVQTNVSERVELNFSVWAKSVSGQSAHIEIQLDIYKPLRFENPLPAVLIIQVGTSTSEVN